MATNRTGHGLNILLLVLGLVRLLATGAHGQAAMFSVTFVGAVGYNAVDNNLDLGMNDLGAVVGTNVSGHAFMWKNGTATDLGTLDGGKSGAAAINDAGVIVGTGTAVGGGYHAFVYSGGAMTDIGTLGGGVGGYSAAYAINNSGVIVGGSALATGIYPHNYHAFSYSGGTMTDLGALSGGQGTGLAVNSSGVVAGSSQVGSGGIPQGTFNGFVYSNTTMTDITPVVALAAATGINDSGIAVGWMGDELSMPEAFVYANGETRGIGSFFGDSGVSQAYGINNAGVIVGTADYTAFVYANGVMTDLNSLTGGSSVRFNAAWAINNAGQIVVTDSSNNAYLLTPIPTVPPPTPARLINISTRAMVGTGDDILIPGFVIGGSGTETLLIRADGPALGQFGVSGVLAKPTLSVFDDAGRVLASNTGWGSNSNPSQIASTAASVGAFALPGGSADCALLLNLPAGAYTVQVSGINGTTGIALAEVYEVSSTGTQLINISTRAQVGTGAGVMIPGFVISGHGSIQALVRADGPALAQFGVSGALAEPSLTVFDNSGSAVTTNTGWLNTVNSPSIVATESVVGAFSLVIGSADSAQLVSLVPGAYTMEVSGVGSTTGIALAEVYQVP